MPAAIVRLEEFDCGGEGLGADPFPVFRQAELPDERLQMLPIRNQTLEQTLVNGQVLRVGA